MSTLLRVDHQRLHRLMRQYFRSMANQWTDRIASLDYGRGRPNTLIAEAVTLDGINEMLDRFYQNFPEFGC